MSNNQQKLCRVASCNEHVPHALEQEGMCLDHFVEGTYARARHAVQSAQKELPLDASAFEWMFEDTKLALKALVRNSDQPYREVVTELITALANVHEYLRQQATEPARAQVRTLDAAVSGLASRRAAGQGKA
jgi:hypothetical protein